MPKENVTYLRLEPRIKYCAHLIARSKGQGFAEFIESVLREYAEFTTIKDQGIDIPVCDLIEELWSDHPADRMALIGNRFPDMLTERERTLWERIVCESQCFWRVDITGDPIAVSPQTFKFKLWREVMPIYDGMTRDEMLVEANRFSKERSNIPNWYTNKASIAAIREREAKLSARAKATDRKAANP